MEVNYKEKLSVAKIHVCFQTHGSNRPTASIRKNPNAFEMLYQNPFQAE